MVEKSRQQDRRIYPRTKFDWPVKLCANKKELKGKIKDISRRGLAIRTNSLLKTNEQVSLAIQVIGYDEVITANGVVVRAEVVKPDILNPVIEVGIRFTQILREDFRDFTGNVVSEWKEIRHLFKEKQETLYTEKKSYILPAIILVVVICIVFTHKYINKMKTTQVESQGQSHQKETESVEIKPGNHIKIKELQIIHDAKMLQDMRGSAE